jgi:23S rRNA pseudouridine1911/1915/1917 synthase
MSPSPALQVLFEDRHCLVVAKPARLLTASDKTGDETLIGLARAYNASRQAEGKKGYLAPLHFLDRPVSGVVMFAQSSKAASRLSAQLREGRIEKTYLAVVCGPAPGAAGLLEDWLLKDKAENVVTVVPPGTALAKPCKLGFRRLGARGEHTYLELSPKTGRSHQIRVQLASRGMPIFGDKKYGAPAAWDGMIALHARRVRVAPAADAAQGRPALLWTDPAEG